MRTDSPDFQRNLHCLLGLPFDAVTLEQSAEQIRQAAFNGTPCFFSTPNLNFLIAARSNEPFRQSVIHSDLSLADGMPIVWLAKLLSVPIAERVAGSDVFEVLRKRQGRKIKVFFFGGLPGMAERAMKALNAEAGGLECVGFESPGFGSIVDMSAPETIAKINASGAEFLVVSLGAVKGQAWIEHNLDALTVPVVSHLGAVLNFVAGSVERAPGWMQRRGLEWLWRVMQEPVLWRRYLQDFKGLLGIAIVNIPSFYLAKVLFALGPKTKLTVSSINAEGDSTRLVLGGYLHGAELSILREALKAAWDAGQDVSFDMTQVSAVDSAFAGLLLMAKNAWSKQKKRIHIVNIPWKINLYLVSMGVEMEEQKI